MPQKLDFPVALQLTGRSVLVVGAGKVATGRIRQLVEVGARVKVVATRASDEVRGLAASGAIELHERRYENADAAGAFVIFTAVDDREVTRAVVEEARATGRLVNAADIPEWCDFHVPAIGRRGPVVIAVSTSGHAPALAALLRNRLMDVTGPEWGVLARLLNRLRRFAPGGPDRARRMREVIDGGAAPFIARGDRRSLFALIRRVFGPTQENA